MGSLERKVHLINWEVVCTQKEKGGLGIRKINLLNKPYWVNGSEDLPLKRTILEEGDRGEVWPRGLGWRTNEAHGTFRVGVWKEILKGQIVLSQNSPQLFALEVHRNATVNEVWDSSFGQRGWNLIFSRDFNDWELDLIGDLLNMPMGFRISSEEDSMFWK
ncbi:hypothetical protein CK203_043247 [Vitis vinifera]|uniref:Uncharacterized protein n=1 Tax=Vitis vinifera TaxID=29760 RepID=A0A438HPB1_VITVI|nr:hypothetical protein CK203_043247 [Vitis vinifera]